MLRVVLAECFLGRRAMKGRKLVTHCTSVLQLVEPTLHVYLQRNVICAILKLHYAMSKLPTA